VRKQVERLEHHADAPAQIEQLAPGQRAPGFDSHPALLTRPRVAGSSWLMQRSKVLLPEPLGPMIATTSPLAISKHTSCNTG